MKSNRSVLIVRGNRSNDWADRTITPEHNLKRSIVGGGGQSALLRSTIRVMGRTITRFTKNNDLRPFYTQSFG
jgi:hypothetical protein